MGHQQVASLTECVSRAATSSHKKTEEPFTYAILFLILGEEIGLSLLYFHSSLFPRGYLTDDRPLSWSLTLVHHEFTRKKTGVFWGRHGSMEFVYHRHWTRSFFQGVTIEAKSVVLFGMSHYSHTRLRAILSCFQSRPVAHYKQNWLLPKWLPKGINGIYYTIPNSKYFFNVCSIVIFNREFTVSVRSLLVCHKCHRIRASGRAGELIAQ